MPQLDDQPKIWTGDDVFVDDMPQEMPGTDIATIEEAPLPSLEEQENIVATSNLKEDNKNMLNALVELNKTAAILAQIQNDETVEMQNKVIQATCTNFVQTRMMNNATAEALKNKLLGNLMQNIDVLDLETQAKIYNDLTEVSSIDMQQALAKMGGSTGTPMGNTGGGINLTLNNITGDGAGVTQNTVAVGTTPPVSNLDTLNNLSTAMGTWKNAPKKVKPVVDVEGTAK
ncbi:MAG: hypothetical protein J5691_01585 [Bacilli bacterium]|nr:hypothetical protein [Bacilli bacterium]